jgi:fumarate hydratase subunit alpha
MDDIVFTELSAEGVASALRAAIPSLATILRPDIREALEAAARRETHPRALQVLDQLLENARIAARDQVPLCQDTGAVWVCLEVGSEETIPGDVLSGLDAAAASAYRAARLRMSMLADALVDRTNTGDNTPVFTELRTRPGTGATLHIMLKGGGSDNASRVVMLAPGAGLDGVRAAVLACVHEKATNACPPLIIGVGVGAVFDQVAGLAKHALLRPVGSSSPVPQVAAFERELLEAVNATGIGPAGLGGATTALAVHVETAPCHIAALPVAINMGCVATRSLSIPLVRSDEEARS